MSSSNFGEIGFKIYDVVIIETYFVKQYFYKSHKGKIVAVL